MFSLSFLLPVRLLSYRACPAYFHCVAIDDIPRLEGLFLRQKRFFGSNR
jgi:hypothetical protein